MSTRKLSNLPHGTTYATASILWVGWNNTYGYYSSSCDVGKKRCSHSFVLHIFHLDSIAREMVYLVCSVEYSLSTLAHQLFNITISTLTIVNTPVQNHNSTKPHWGGMLPYYHTRTHAHTIAHQQFHARSCLQSRCRCSLVRGKTLVHC